MVASYVQAQDYDEAQKLKIVEISTWRWMDRWMACDPGHALRVLGVCSCRRRSNADGNQHFDLTTEYELIGSRYAVVLCCSRSGRPGPAYVSLNASSGASRLAKTCVHGPKVCILILFVCQRRRDEHYSCVDVVRSTVVRDTGVTRVGINRLSAVLRGTMLLLYFVS